MQFANIFWQGSEHPRRVAAQRDGVWVVLPSVWAGQKLEDTDAVLHQGIPHNILENLVHNAPPLASGEWTWRSAVTHPEKILCIGLNYRRHALESHLAIPSSPMVFSKFTNALAAHQESVPIPSVTTQLDYEVELALVIGHRAHHLTVQEALSCVWGYTIADDISARDLQMQTSQWLLGKSCDKFLPLGPLLVSADEIPDPDALDIALELNGAVRQHSNTRDMIFSCAEIVSYLSHIWTLEPGDVICTGTPEGVILGQPADQRQWLKPRDAVRLTIQGLGEQTTLFVDAAE